MSNLKELSELEEMVMKLKSESCSAQAEVDRLDAAIKEYEHEIIHLVHGVRVGSVVVRNGIEYKVTEVLSAGTGHARPFLFGVYKKKNGDWSKVSQYIGSYDWTVQESK